MPLAHQIAAHKSWAKTENRNARTRNGRDAFEKKFLTENGGDPQRAESARKAFYLELAQKSAKARRQQRELKEQARRQRIDALLSGQGGGDDAT
jgi:hypothetical protein